MDLPHLRFPKVTDKTTVQVADSVLRMTHPESKDRDMYSLKLRLSRHISKQTCLFTNYLLSVGMDS